jgi:hypothetical protein
VISHQPPSYAIIILATARSGRARYPVSYFHSITIIIMAHGTLLGARNARSARANNEREKLLILLCSKKTFHLCRFFFGFKYCFALVTEKTFYLGGGQEKKDFLSSTSS